MRVLHEQANAIGHVHHHPVQRQQVQVRELQERAKVVAHTCRGHEM
jgi:hypothetical protein